MKRLVISLVKELPLPGVTTFTPARTYTYEGEDITVENAGGLLVFRWTGNELAFNFREVESYSITHID